ncbi:Protein of unknown function [Bacillus cytotoxicus]|uniref:Uncharacterized protein n=1 Tax=Bacillus cytotoxicus TaxID=580165 RepID=A0AAX2CGB0_9BACI|nr:Protein of unknown function [Bacillus cytotoxicus]SCN35811.1 Protein of unknown function [Bacillus cytotoxicus]
MKGALEVGQGHAIGGNLQ